MTHTPNQLVQSVFDLGTFHYDRASYRQDVEGTVRAHRAGQYCIDSICDQWENHVRDTFYGAVEWWDSDLDMEPAFWDIVFDNMSASWPCTCPVHPQFC